MTWRLEREEERVSFCDFKRNPSFNALKARAANEKIPNINGRLKYRSFVGHVVVNFNETMLLLLLIAMGFFRALVELRIYRINRSFVRSFRQITFGFFFLFFLFLEYFISQANNIIRSKWQLLKFIMDLITNIRFNDKY